METASNLLHLRGISHQIGDRILLENIDLSVTPGEIVTLIGPNGAGKSTLVKIALQLISPTQGQVHLERNLNVGYVPQSTDLDHSLPMTVERFLQLAGKNNKAQIKETLKTVEVDALVKTPLQNVSGGEMRRILLARALLKQPDLLILDEPTAGVDVSGQADIFKLIQTIRDKTGCGVLLISHDLHIVMAGTDKVVCLNRHLCCSGHPEDVRQHPEFVSLFGQSDANRFAIYTHHHDHDHDLHGDVHPHD